MHEIVSLADLAIWSAVAQTLIALAAAIIVWHEYSEHKKARRADLAINLTAHLRADELIAFAVSSLDWGAGQVIIPPGWRDLLEKPLPTYAAANIEDALSVRLNSATADDPLRLLYRHAFVRLFDHLQIVALHIKRDPALLTELEPMADLAHRLCRPLYVQDAMPEGQRDLYRNAIAGWYPREVLAFVEALDRRFPEAS